MIDVTSYWPKPTGSQTLVNTFDNGFVHEYSAAPGGYRLRETLNGVWQDDWFYRIDPARGVLEYADDYPKTKWFQKLMVWATVVHQPMVPGKEIVWGNKQEPIDTIEGPCETSGIGGQCGWQRVQFKSIWPMWKTPAGMFPDVLVLEYWQTWGTGKSKGATMWFAPGMGQIQAVWEADGYPTGYGMALKSTTGQPVVA